MIPETRSKQVYKWEIWPVILLTAIHIAHYLLPPLSPFFAPLDLLVGLFILSAESMTFLRVVLIVLAVLLCNFVPRKEANLEKMLHNLFCAIMKA